MKDEEESTIHPSSFILHPSDSGDAGVDGFGLLGDAVPAEGGIDGGSTVASHPTAAAVIGQQRAQTPGYRVGRVVHLHAVDAVPDELGRSAALGADNGLVGRPALEDDDAEGFIAAGHRHDVARLEQVVQLAAAPIAQHPQGVPDAELMGDATRSLRMWPSPTKTNLACG